ncbi:hypothetical protein, partial [Marinobacter salarius]|uniref:hypothetical protein n=1 Tax=Marinobacter salarius TaxID=1420917 RepID=UPI0032ED14D7
MNKQRFVSRRLSLACAGAILVSTPAAFAQLEEVIVTAQKRAQSEQDIGMAISSASGLALRERRIESPLDLQAISPNINIKEIS